MSNSKKILVIVESPSKCKKIEQYLGNEYKVIASYGHFTKLDDLKQINFKNFQIKYKIDKSKVLKTIKDEIKQCKDVIIATDDDREGEAIGWMICTFCKLDINKTKKIVFQEITKTALNNALKNITKINMDRVKSQQTRQILDIYLGYKVSPLLWKYIQHKLSAGRCQTPALKLIYENQQEIDKLDNDTHYNVKASFTANKIIFNLNKNIEKDNIEKWLKEVSEKKNWQITDVLKKETKENPPNILITSSLQQKAHSMFNYSPKLTMSLAQKLYENGYITYMRTDSACYSKEFINKLSDFINKQYGKEYINKNIDKLSVNKNSNKSQDAHEGIRVCDLNLKEINLDNRQANKLYAFIYKHTIQCGMSEAKYNESHYTIDFMDEYKFKYIDKIFKFKGWRILEKEKTIQSFVAYLDLLYSGNTNIVINYLEAKEKLIKQLLHYNEASLVKQLEKINIGRPSTFSSLVQSIIDKKYVNKKNIDGKDIIVKNYFMNSNREINLKSETTNLNYEMNKLEITPLGKQVSEFCYSHFNDIFNYDFTNKMENILDEIADGKQEQNTSLNLYINQLNELIENTNKLYKDSPEKISKVADTSLHCGHYKNNPIYIKNGKYGYYLNIGKKENISLNEFKGFNVENKIKSQEEIKEDEKKTLIEYIENKKNIQNENICVEINKDCSIRKSKYGYYIFYKTKQMKQPKFLKYNDEKEDKINDWIVNKNKELIKDYIIKKYKINI